MTHGISQPNLGHQALVDLKRIAFVVPSRIDTPLVRCDNASAVLTDCVIELVHAEERLHAVIEARPITLRQRPPFGGYAIEATKFRGSMPRRRAGRLGSTNLLAQRDRLARKPLRRASGQEEEKRYEAGRRHR
jgi:hypothetical protein